MDIKELLNKVKSGDCSVEEATEQLTAKSFDDIGFAKIDHQRRQRTGGSETIYCPGKSNLQLAGIVQNFMLHQLAMLGTRCSENQYEYLKELGLPVEFYPDAGVLLLPGKEKNYLPGRIAVCTGGTADIPVAEEAARTVEFFGGTVERFYDVGVAGIHRLFANIDKIREVDVVIAVAGMEGALGGVLAGLIHAPVIAVPTSVGYGASFGGIAPLLTMLNSCAEGMSVVNIDNGFGAGVLGCRMLRMIYKRNSK